MFKLFAGNTSLFIFISTSTDPPLQFSASPSSSISVSVSFLFRFSLPSHNSSTISISVSPTSTFPEFWSSAGGISIPNATRSHSPNPTFPNSKTPTRTRTRSFSDSPSPFRLSAAESESDLEFMVFILGPAMFLPNVLVVICRHCCRRPIASLWILFATFFLNVGHGALITHLVWPGDLSMLVLEIGYGGWGFLQIFICCLRGCTELTGLGVFCEMCSTVVSSEQLVEQVERNRSSPPRVFVHARAWHEESREVMIEEEPYEVEIYDLVNEYDHRGQFIRQVKVHRGWETHWRYVRTHYSAWGRVDQGGGHFTSMPRPLSYQNRLYPGATEYRTVTTFDKTVEFKYGSWQEMGEPVVFPNVVVVFVNFTVQYIFDEPTTQQVEVLRLQLLEEARHYDTSQSSVVKPTTPGFVVESHGAVDQGEVDRIRKVFATVPGYLLWMLCLVTGFQPIIESFARYSTQEYGIECTKLISVGMGCRGQYNGRDEAAAELAIDRGQFRRRREEELSAFSSEPLLGGGEQQSYLG